MQNKINDYLICPPHAADLHLFNTGENQGHQVYDVTVHSPFVPSNIKLSLKGQSTFFEDKCKNKNTAPPGRAFIANPNTEFIPVVFDTLGNMDSGVYKLLQTIATKKSSVNGYSYDSCFQRILKSLMCTFFQYSAKMIWQRICVIDNNGAYYKCRKHKTYKKKLGQGTTSLLLLKVN